MFENSYGKSRRFPDHVILAFEKRRKAVSLAVMTIDFPIHGH